MDKKESFKAFASSHPELIKHVQNGSMTWQKFYEIYDIYGESESAWQNYLADATVSTSAFSIADKFKNIDMSSIQEHIKTAQKALNLVQELTTKSADGVSDLAKGPITPRPLNKFFED